MQFRGVRQLNVPATHHSIYETSYVNMRQVKLSLSVFLKRNFLGERVQNPKENVTFSSCYLNLTSRFKPSFYLPLPLRSAFRGSFRPLRHTLCGKLKVFNRSRRVLINEKSLNSESRLFSLPE